jgi:hypothetical protein
MPPKDLLKAWIDESYRAQAPKKLVAGLPAPTRAAEETAKKRPKSGSSSTARRSRRTRGTV